MKITAYNQHDVGSSHEPWSCFIAYQSTRDGPTSLCNQVQPERMRRQPRNLLHRQPAIIFPKISFTIFAATVAVTPATSCTGLNSTTSAPTISPSIACRCAIASRTDIPPGSRCDTPGANAGSSTSISNVIYIGPAAFNLS